MATYLVLPDDYAGWNPTGRSFALIGGGVGAVGLLAWMSLHGHLGAFSPVAASDRVFLSGLSWLGMGGFGLMIIAALGSISLSLRSRGTVTVTDQGVLRAVGSREDTLVWSEVEGLVAMPYGGVTLISAGSKPNLTIPRFVDDYRGCIAEIKTHGVRALPPDRLRPKRAVRLRNSIQSGLVVIFSIVAMNGQHAHRVRLASLSAALASMVWALSPATSQTESRRVSVVVFLGLLLFVLWRMSRNW